MANLRVEIDGIDVSDFVRSVPSLAFSFGDYGEYTEIGSINMQGDNTTGFWNQTNSNSIFYHRNWSDWIATIYDNTSNDILWEGVITGVSLSDNGKTADIKLASKMSEFLNKSVYAYISDKMTPAEIAEDMLILWGVPYYAPSFAKSKVIHEAGGLEISANINADNHMTLLDALKELADIGVARLFTWKNKIYYQAYDPYEDEPDAIVVSQEDLWSVDSFSMEKKSPLDGYKIETVNTTISDGTLTDDANVKSIDLSADNAFISYALNGAYHIGTSYMTLSDKTYIQAGIKLDRNLGVSLKPSSLIRLYNPPLIVENTDFEILNIDNSSKLYSVVEVKSV